MTCLFSGRLFMQWKQMDWPILADSLNLIEVTAVPITLAIDEHGIIRTRLVINFANPRRWIAWPTVPKQCRTTEH